MPITVSTEAAQANLYQYLNQLDDGTIDKVIVNDGEVELCQIVTYPVYVAADPASAAGIIEDVVSAYSSSPSAYTNALYNLLKKMRDAQAGPDAQKATGRIDVPAAGGSVIADTETFVLTNAAGVGATYEFNSSAGITTGNVEVAFLGGDTQAQLVGKIAAAITGSGQGITAVPNPGDTAVLLTQSDPGAAGNYGISEAVADGNFVVTGFTGGTDVDAQAGSLALKNSKNDALPRAVVVPSDHAAAIGL